MKKMRFFWRGLFCFFILMLSSGMPVAAAPTDPVTIPDANLRAAIEAKLRKSSGATITEAEMNGMTRQLSARSRSISSLTGLEHATGITDLLLGHNNISDLSPLSDLTQLTSLNIDGNPMTDLSDLKDLVNLTLLSAARPGTDANRNAPTSADLSFLTKLTALTYLKLDSWTIRDISALANLTALEQLFLGYNHITDISPLANLTQLEILHIRYNPDLMDIATLGSLTTLEELILLANSKISDISALGNLSNLQSLWLHRTNITSDGLAEVLPSLSSLSTLILNGTRISDLSVLDRLPDTPPMWNVQVRYIDDPPGADDSKGWLLKDLTPLVALMEKGKFRAGEAEINVLHNWNLDYDSLYTDIPALAEGIAAVKYSPVVPGLRRRSEAHHVGDPQSAHTFSVSAYSTFSDHRASWSGNRYTAEKVNEEFEGVPVTWKVTAPDGTVTEDIVPTGDDGLSSWTITLGDLDETHTVEAIVPANPANTREASAGPSHPELKVTFTATAVAPPVITLTLDNAGYTHIQWIADVSGLLPEAYAYYYKKSASREWIKETDLSYSTSRFSFIHSELQPGTSYDFQLYGLRGEHRIESNVLTARTLSRTPPRTPPPEPPPGPPAPSNNPPAFTSASTVNVAENTTSVIRIVAEDPDTDDEIMNYAITGGADRAMLEIGGTHNPSDMLRFKAAPDFENPQDADTDNVCILMLTATSGVGDRELTATQTLTITVTDVDETPPEPVNNPPVFTSASSVSVAENTTAVVTVVAEDPDAEDEITGYAITGGADQALFELGGASTPLDMLRFKAAPDFENPQDANKDNIYTVILTATSGVGDRELTATQTLTVTVTDVDEPVPLPVQPPVDPPKEPPVEPPVERPVGPPAEPPVDPPVDPLVNTPVQPPVDPPNRPPVFTSASAVSVAENTTAVITVVAEDPDPEDEITNYAITGGADQALFELSGVSTPLDMLRFKAAPDFETRKDADKDNVYRVILTATSGVGARELTAIQALTVTATDVDEPIAPPVDAPVGPSAGSGSGGSGSGGPPLIPLGTQSFIFNEIGNFSDDTYDWIELKNVCNTPLDLSEWQLRLITNYTLETGIAADIVSFPDFLLPPHAVLLVANTDPSHTHLASGLNIATGGRSRGAQHPYFVTRDLRLPSTPFLLILQHTAPGNGNPTLIDVAGNLFLEVLPDGSEAYFDPDTQDFAAAAAPLTDEGVYQRQRLEVQGYLAAAWRPSGYHGGIGYDRRVEKSVALGTPGYRRDPSPSQPVAYRLVFNEIRNASDDTHDWIELKNVCGAGVRLKDWHVSIVHDAGGAADEEVSVVSFPDYTLPRGGCAADYEYGSERDGACRGSEYRHGWAAARCAAFVSRRACLEAAADPVSADFRGGAGTRRAND